MAGSIGDAIFKLMGRDDPRQLLASAIAGGGQPADPQVAQATPGAEGTGGAAAAPAASPPESGVYKSPQELVQLYMQVMERQDRNAMIDRGIGLMGASLAHPENRAGIMAAFNREVGSSPGDLFNNLIKLQTGVAEVNQKAAQRATIPAIAAKYGLDIETAMYLFDTGKLDAVIAEAEKPDNQLVQGNDGKWYNVNKKTGEMSQGYGPEKTREIEITDGPNNSKIAVYKDDKTPVAGREPIVPESRKIISKEGAGGSQIPVYEDDLTPVPNREPLVPKDPYFGDTELVENWKRNNVDREMRGEPPRSLEDWKAIQSTTRQIQFTDGAGNPLPDPPADMVWDVGPDGKVRQDANGAPLTKIVPGSKTDLANKEAEQKIKDAAKVTAAQESAKTQTADIVTTEIDRALGMIDKAKNSWLPATGYGGLTSTLPLTPAYGVEEMLKTVRANVGFDKLQAMRAASPNGAALGPVSDFENQLLQSTFGNLNLTQDPAVVDFNLRRIKRIYQGVIAGEFVNKDGTPNQDAVNKAMIDAQKDIPLDELLKIYETQDGN